MAEIVAAFAGPVIEVVKWVAQPILRQFNYLCCFTSIISGLELEAVELDLATRELQERVERERENVQVISPQVESWLSKSNDIKGQKDTILDQVPSVKSGCLKLGARFSLCRRAKKTTDCINELRLQRRSFDAISLPGPPAATQELPLGKTYNFESRKKIEEDIMATLRGGDVNIIGICGMGGLGKTTMAQRIMNRVLKERVFEEVVITTISQQVDKSKVQVEIGDSLGLKLQDYNSPQVRAQKLHDRLTGIKRILLVLDDIWAGLELQSLGIPCDSKGCTILVTSRNKDALSEMNVQKVFGMEVLRLEDSRFLFRERAGTCVDDARLNPIAEEVVGECGGLPLALIAIGAALKDEKDVSIWNDALRQLRRCDREIPVFIEKVYNPIKLSYDFLRSRQAKSLLLLCCLFPEDAKIPLEQLTYFCMGLGIFEGIMNLEGARNKLRTLAKMLKSRSLLLDGFYGGEVRMHDVVRDVCRIIAKQGKYIGGNDCAWISSAELMGERTSRLGFLNLRLLLLNRKSNSEEEFKLDSAFILDGIRGLLVLWIEWSPLTSLPQGIEQLKNLNTLVLYLCTKLKTISVVGELVNLEILICRNCDLLEELPPGMKELNQLKLLELTKCKSLQSIGRGIISSLVGLEELKMSGSFIKWEAEDREERKNAGLKELQSLTNLTCLEIEIDDPTLVAENMHISTKLERFCIIFCKSDYLPQEFQRYEKKMSLSLERETCLGHWIEMQLLRETESLSLRGNGAMIVDLKKCQKIKCLYLSECETMKSIVTASLEHMELHSLPQLQEVLISFQNISSITISDCPILPTLVNLSTAGNNCLPQLERISIERCEMMEQVLLWKEEDNNSGSRIINPHHVRFPKLNEIQLEFLPNLDTFCQGIEGIKFPLLTEIDIKWCPKWTSMVSSGGVLESKEKESGGGSSNADAYSSHLFCKVSYGNFKKLVVHDRNPFCGHEIPASSYQLLEELTIWGCEGSRSLLSSSIAKNLVNLKKLIIKECNEMEQVIEDEEEDEVVVSGGRSTLLFPKLEELRLSVLPNLERFCERKCVVELPSLWLVNIVNCPVMKSFSMGPLAVPNLKSIKMGYGHEYIIDGGKDLNGAVQQHYLAGQKEEEERERGIGGEREEERKWMMRRLRRIRKWKKTKKN